MTLTKHEQRAEGRSSEAWTREMVEDLLADAISDSLDMDWQPKDAVRCIMRDLDREGLTVIRTSAEAELVEATRGLLKIISDALQDDFLDASTDAGAILCGDVCSDAIYRAQQAIASRRGEAA